MVTSKIITDISYNAISNVLESWEIMRKVANYEEVAGACLFQHLVEANPGARDVFDIPTEIDIQLLDMQSQSSLQMKRIIFHASNMLRNFDIFLDLLGPDLDLLSECIYDLGIKHARYGVKSDMYQDMGVALIRMLQEMLKDKFTDAMKDAWEEVYDVISKQMAQAHVDEEAKTVSCT